MVSRAKAALSLGRGILQPGQSIVTAGPPESRAEPADETERLGLRIGGNRF